MKNQAEDKSPRAAATPAEQSALERTPPVQVFERHLELRQLLSVFLLCLLSVVMLAVSFSPFDCWYMAYLALVPWTLAMAGGVRRGWTIFFGWLAGLIFWALMLYWLVFPTGVGYVAGVFYLSLYWLIAAVLVRAAMRRNWPMWIVLPVIWVSLEFLRARAGVLSFPWFHLSQTQYPHTRLIQIADVTGQYGVSFFVAMVNGMIIDLLSAPLFTRTHAGVRLSRHVLWGIVATVCAVGGLLGYGSFRLAQKTTSPGPTIGIVQEAVPITLSGPTVAQQTFLEYHLQRCLEFVGQDCDLIIWPETMLPTGLNRQVLAEDISGMAAMELRSLASRLWNPQSVRQAPCEYLRVKLRQRIGLLPMGQYRPPAARFLLNHFVTPAQVLLLTEGQVRALGEILFGAERVAGADDAALRAAVGVYAEAEDVPKIGQLPEKNLRLVGGIFLGADGMQQFPPADRKGLSDAILKNLLTQRATDRPKLQTMRGQGAMLEVCSLLVGCPILAGGAGIHRNSRPTGPDDIWMFQNDVLWIDTGGQGDFYSKVHLVPFSEYVPFKYSWPWLHKLLRGAVPEVMPQLNPGEVFTRFEVRKDGRKYQLVTPVCFEGTFAELCRQMVKQGPKDHLIMANLSNDGWFVYRRGDGPYQGTTEQPQHLVHYVFRAVENRIPVVRAVNTGISASINSRGQIESVLEKRVEEYRRKVMVAGTLKVYTSVDSRRTVYSRLGDVFAMLVIIFGVGLIGMLFRKRRLSAEKE